MKQYLLIDGVTETSVTLLGITEEIDVTDEEFDRISDLKVGDMVTIEAELYCKRVS